MGHKVHPYGFRLGVTRTWTAKWYHDKEYTDLLKEDIAIRQLVDKRLSNASVSGLEIERNFGQVTVTVHTAKPGIVIGKQGANVERLRNMLEKELKKKVHLSIEEIKTPETDARLIAESIAEQIARRVSYRRAMKHAVQQAMRRGAKGVKIRLSGRLGGAEMSRSVTEMDGRVPLQTLRADIDYGIVHAHTTYGRIGVKVWVYRGDVMPTRKVVEPVLPELATTAD